MIKRHLLLLLCFLCISPFCSASDKEPPRLKRGDSYFGIHLDFHATLNDKEIGKNTTPEMVNTLIDIVNPDFIQIDCKGHPGISSYRTKVGHSGDIVATDPLRIWRKVTADRGIALYMHYSGVWDTESVKRHPDWAAIDPSGKPDTKMTSVFGPYVDKLMIPQLLELALDYKVDGVWIDGECWATVPDYSDKAKNAFTQQTGIKEIPQKLGDPNWDLWLNFHREAFRKYVRHYIKEIKQKAPNLQIASNWAFTDHVPEPVSALVDFISGDIADGVNAARFSSRLIQTQNRCWDLMAWGLCRDNDNHWHKKGAVHLEYEASCVLSQGGSFQASFEQSRDGSVDLKKVDHMGEVGRFCRARKAFCKGSKAVPQIAMIVPTDAHYARISQSSSALFPWALSWQRGFLQTLLDNQYSVEIYNEPTLIPQMGNYPAFAICEWESLNPDFQKKLIEQVRAGAGLLLVGEKTFHLFDQDFKGIEFKQNTSNTTIKAPYVLKTGSLGKGKVAWIPNSISESYFNKSDSVLRELVAQGVSFIFPHPQVTVTGSHEIDVSLRQLADGRLSVHLVNMAAPKTGNPVIETIKPLGPLSVTISTSQKPNRVFLEPEHKSCPFSWKEGKITLQVEKVDIYNILVLE